MESGCKGGEEDEGTLRRHGERESCNMRGCGSSTYIAHELLAEWSDLLG